AIVVQTYGFRASKGALIPEDARSDRRLKKLQSFLDQLATLGPGLLITYKSAEPLLQVGPGWEKAHFRDLRGLDRYKDKEIAVILGRLQPSTEAVERLACGLVFDQAIQLTLLGSGMYPEQQRGFRLRDGSSWGTPVPVHPDGLVQCLF